MNHANKKYVPALRERCLDRLKLIMSNYELDLHGLPRNIIEEIFFMIQSPAELEHIMQNNIDIPGLDKAAEYQWMTLFNNRFWIGKSTPLELPPGKTWRSYYKEMEEDYKKKYGEQRVTVNIPFLKQEKEKSQKPKILSLEETRKVQRMTSQPRKTNLAKKNANLTPAAKRFLAKVQAMQR